MASIESLEMDLLRAKGMLERGDVPDAYRLLGGPVYDGRYEPAIIAGEASSLIRDGLIGEAIDRIAGYLAPRLGGRVRYAATGCEAAR